MSNSPSSLYTIISTLHRSSVHIVYLVKSRQTKELLVIKTIDPKWQADPLLKQRLKDEAEINMRLSHPHIRRTVDMFEEDRNLYVVYQYIEGKLLSEFLNWGKLSFSAQQVIKWMDMIVDALAHAHSQGVYHGQINPHNIIVNEEGEPCIYGFGKAHNSWLDEDPHQNGMHPILFLAPEVYGGGKPNAASDIYSLAVLAYLMLCGRLPWTINKDLGVKKQKESSFEKPVINPEFLSINIPEWLFGIINRCLNIDPKNRYSCMEELKQAILLQEVRPPFESKQPEAPLAEEPLTEEQPVIEEPSKIELVSEVEIPPIVEEPLKIEEPVVEELPKQAIPPAGVDFPKLEEPVKVVSPSKVEAPKPQAEYPKTEPGKVAIDSSKVEIPKAEITKVENVPPPKPSPITPPPKKAGFTVQKSDSMDPKVKRLGTIMAIAAILIVAFAVLKYTVFTEKPIFSSEVNEQQEDDDLDLEPVPNRAFRMVYVKGDSTSIGSMAPEAASDEFPPLKLKVPSFWMSSCEITNEEWAMVYPQHFYNLSEKHQPVTNVSFLEVLEYCNEKSLLDNLEPCYDFLTGYTCDFSATGYRLPTEAEWEYAAKEGQSEAPYSYSGSDDPGEIGWYLQNSDSELHPVGQKKPNALGLYDMSGNAYEWVWNWYAPYSRAANPLYGPETGSERVIRGGSFSHEPNEMRVTQRSHVKQFTKSPYLGFRVVKKGK